MTAEELIALAAWSAFWTAALAACGEWLHARRVQRTRLLAFGPGGRQRSWTRGVPVLRVAALAGIAWSLVTLVAYHHHTRERLRSTRIDRHLMVLMDVSPSMLLSDGGEAGDQSRARRAAEVLKSVLDRVPGDRVRFSGAIFYTEARMLMSECQDRELMLHCASDVPFHITFEKGKTDLLKALNQTGKFMRQWPRKSATLLVLTDGGSVAPTGLNQMPSAVDEVIFAGVGDSGGGIFYDGHISRQDGTSLASLARRLGGVYYDTNSSHIPSTALRKLASVASGAAKWQFDRRMLALAVLGVSALVVCALPLLLEFFGSAWKPSAGASREARHGQEAAS